MGALPRPATIRKSCEYRVVYRLHTANGRVHSVREEGVPEFGSDGSVVALRGVILEAVDGSADTEEVLTEAGLSTAEIEKLRS